MPVDEIGSEAPHECEEIELAGADLELARFKPAKDWAKQKSDRHRNNLPFCFLTQLFWAKISQWRGDLGRDDDFALPHCAAFGWRRHGGRL